MKTMKNMKAQKGFTLIELVIVIVILGILAATAAPKFINLQGDAKGATLEAIKASMETANSAIHAKALINNVTGATGALGSVAMNSSTNVNVINSWPTAESATWTALLDITSADFTILEADASASDGTKVIYVYPTTTPALTTANIPATACFVTYTESTSTDTKPAIAVTKTGC